MKKIYLGCSLTHAPKKFIEAIEELKSELSKSYEVLKFIGLVGGTPSDVFHNDTEMVRQCELFVAECTYQGRSASATNSAWRWPGTSLC